MKKLRITYKDTARAARAADDNAHRKRVQQVCGLSDGMMAYLDKYPYAADLYEKIAAKLEYKGI